MNPRCDPSGKPAAERGEMSYMFFSMINRKARKAHRCIWCGQAIKPGEHYIDERSLYDGRIQRHRWHPECKDAADEYYRDFNEEEFSPYDNERPNTTDPSPPPPNLGRPHLHQVRLCRA